MKTTTIESEALTALTAELGLAEKPAAEKPAKKTAKQKSKFPPLPNARFGVIYADPPWDYKGQTQHNGAGGRDTGSASRHYPTVKLADLKKLQIAGIADENCLLFMWATSPHLDQAIELGKAWGFDWATVGFVWDKVKVNPGFYTMSQCELCLIFKRGKIPQPRGARDVRQLVTAMRGKHSAKPDEVRNRIDRMFPMQSKIELFARVKKANWVGWGLESEKPLPKNATEISL